MDSYPGKRMIDLAVAGTACVAFAPIVAGITLASWLEDRGPPLFSQPRVGRDRHPFTILKFMLTYGKPRVRVVIADSRPCTPRKFAPVRSASVRFAPVKSVSISTASRRSAPVRSASFRTAPLKSAR